MRLVVRAVAASTDVRVENAGAFEGPREGGEGLAMIEQRLAVAYRGRASFHIGTEGGPTVAVLTLPVSPEPGEDQRP